MNRKTKDKKTLILIISVCTAFVVVFGTVIAFLMHFAVGRDKEQGGREPIMQNGVWIASVANIDFPSRPDLNRDELMAELDDIVDTASGAGLDAIFFQVRPTADALYKSEIFPVSRYMSTDGTLTLDALEYLTDIAHKKNIKVHAWINPLRVSSSGSAEDLSEDSPARAHSDWIVEYADGKIYFDCGEPGVIELICSGIEEIVKNYDVDGIIFDDYFYPYPKYETDSSGASVIAEFDDGDTFNKYGGDYDDIGDWRRTNVNTMVKKAYDTVKDCDKNCLFGVAPFGIWKNGYGDESGSETRGAQSYSDIYCDTLAWVRGGYVDYIAPQIYWRESDSAAPYGVLCDWWADRLEDSGVQLLVSHAAYRYEEDWESPEGIMTSQVEYAKQKELYGGSIFYGYEEIKNNTFGITDELRGLYGES